MYVIPNQKSNDKKCGRRLYYEQNSTEHKKIYLSVTYVTVRRYIALELQMKVSVVGRWRACEWFLKSNTKDALEHELNETTWGYMVK